MKFMITERFYPDKVKALYQKLAKGGRMLPAGVNYIDSWIDQDLSVCYQLMESGSLGAIQEWADQWKEFGEFEIVQVITSTEARAIALAT